MSDGNVLKRDRLVTVRLMNGPAEGTYAQVARLGQQCWQRVGKPGGVGVDTQMWAMYAHNPLRRGEYVYSGHIVDTDTFGRALKAHQNQGNTHGESYGA